MTKNTPFFPILHVFAPLNDVRAYSAWSWKTTLITWIFGRAWYPLDIRVAPPAPHWKSLDQPLSHSILKKKFTYNCTKINSSFKQEAKSASKALPEITFKSNTKQNHPIIGSWLLALNVISNGSCFVEMSWHEIHEYHQYTCRAQLPFVKFYLQTSKCLTFATGIKYLGLHKNHNHNLCRGLYILWAFTRTAWEHILCGRPIYSVGHHKNQEHVFCLGLYTLWASAKTKSKFFDLKIWWKVCKSGEYSQKSIYQMPPPPNCI